MFGNAAGTADTSGPWTLPVHADYTLTARFGDCSTLWADCHTGLDFAAPTGTPALAATAGTVTFTGNGGAYGNLVKIDHGNGLETWYGHLSSIEVTDATTVRTGQEIGLIGATGNTTGPHLHFEVRQDGVPTDPEPFLQDRGLTP